MVIRIPIMTKLMSSELPPLEMKGRVIPVRGQSPVLPAMMMIVWIKSMMTIPAATA